MQCTFVQPATEQGSDKALHLLINYSTRTRQTEKQKKKDCVDLTVHTHMHKQNKWSQEVLQRRLLCCSFVGIWLSYTSRFSSFMIYLVLLKECVRIKEVYQEGAGLWECCVKCLCLHWGLPNRNAVTLTSLHERVEPDGLVHYWRAACS